MTLQPDGSTQDALQNSLVSRYQHSGSASSQSARQAPNTLNEGQYRRAERQASLCFPASTWDLLEIRSGDG